MLIKKLSVVSSEGKQNPKARRNIIPGRSMEIQIELEMLSYSEKVSSQC